jgi:hypothetical protein
MAFSFYFQFDRLVRKGLQVCGWIKDFQSPQTYFLFCFYIQVNGAVGLQVNVYRK